MYNCFPSGQRGFDAAAFLRTPSPEWFNHAGVGITRSFVREEISQLAFDCMTDELNASQIRASECERAAREFRMRIRHGGESMLVTL